MVPPFAAAEVGEMSRKEMVEILRDLRDSGHDIGCKLNAKTKDMKVALQGFAAGNGGSTVEASVDAVGQAPSPPQLAQGGAQRPESDSCTPAEDGRVQPDDAKPSPAKDSEAIPKDSVPAVPCGPSSTTRSLCLRSFGAVYICAFVSYWLQYPGCFGHNGLMPVDSFWARVSEDQRFSSTDDQPLVLSFSTQDVEIPLGPSWVLALRKWVQFPSLLWFSGSVDVDTMMEGTSIVGVLCGVMAVSGFHHGSVFFARIFVLPVTFCHRPNLSRVPVGHLPAGDRRLPRALRAVVQRACARSVPCGGLAVASAMGQIHGHVWHSEDHGRLPYVAPADGFGISLRVDLPTYV
eukprot:SAG31_NODE_7549_length_1658_cov_1.429121_1_plen_348_part_00